MHMLKTLLLVVLISLFLNVNSIQHYRVENYDAHDLTWDEGKFEILRECEGQSSGTKECPILIETCNQLAALEMKMHFSYKLANDVECAETKKWITDDAIQGFISIGSSSNPFSDTLDGTIKL